MSLLRWVDCADLHGDKLHPVTVSTFREFVADFKPQIKVFSGDAFDLRALRLKATDAEKRESMKRDIDTGSEFLQWYEPSYYLIGNHEDRLFYWAKHGEGVKREYAARAVTEFKDWAKKAHVKVLEYHKTRGILRLGHLKMLHGFFVGKFAAKRTAEVYGACLVGHTHTIDEFPIPGLERRVCRCIGCLCTLDMEYDKTKPDSLRHAHGWAYGLLNDKTGCFHVEQAERIDGHWLIPTAFKDYK